MIGDTVLLFVVCLLAAFSGQWQQHFALRRPAAINLISEDHGIFCASSRYRPICHQLSGPARSEYQSFQQFESYQYANAGIIYFPYGLIFILKHHPLYGSILLEVPRCRIQSLIWVTFSMKQCAPGFGFSGGIPAWWFVCP